MEFQKYMFGCLILAYGVLCLLAGYFEHIRRITFTPAKGVCESITTGRRIILPCYKHTFRYKYDGVEMVGQTIRDYNKLDLQSEHDILVNPMRPTEVLQQNDIKRITRNPKMGWICIGISGIIFLFSAFI